MTGTEKQVKWAEEIKAEVMAALDEMSNTSRKAEFISFRTWIDGKEDASWWINLWQLTRTIHMFLRCAILEFRK